MLSRLNITIIFAQERKKKRSLLEDWNIDSVLPESQVCYEEETMENGETILPSRNTDGLQPLSDGDCTPKKHKRNKRDKKEFHSTEENQNASVSQCGEELERTEKGALCTVKNLPSEGQEQIEAQELYETLLAEADDVNTELPSHIKEKLKRIQILVPFDVPQSHCVETRFTHVPTEEQKRQLADLGVQLKYKKFSSYEDAIICKNWEHFSKEYNFEDVEPFLLFGHKHFCCLKYSERKHFVQYVGHGLPHRTLYSIYARFQMLYRPYVKGKFTEVEDDVIKCHVSKGMDRQPFSTLSKLFNRDRLSIYKRYKWLERELPGEQGRVTWTLQKVEMVIRSLLKVTGLKNVEDLRNRHISLTDWRKVEKDCGIRADCVRDIWRFKLSTQLFCPKPIYLKEIRIKLIKRLYRDDVKYWQDIIWNDIATDFGVGPLFLWALFRKLLKSCYPRHDWEYFRSHFRDIIKGLKKRYIPILKTNSRNYQLQRLRMGENGNLFVLQEDDCVVH
ncbi:hypothetical protein B7P43_G17743 [Cryptotermes secundus]|uniref:Uncharacterized protein n=1 Tax=Cryptotermes secundus TaxID=105785 RepID=A0A2J7RKF5_9NEOP|nr:transcription termination factor 1 isoform X2 [Cryptotermes secundus]PNF41317.1 hypothetical protein B7P43_G17743 [Cryptotermes secundus]